jgi:hypothetical protein
MLRPVFVRYYFCESQIYFGILLNLSAHSTALSSDAFSGFRSRTRDGEVNNREVREASRCLEKSNIPAVAEFLCQDISLDISSVGDICHQYGVCFFYCWVEYPMRGFTQC